jgi:chaperonin GroES
MSTEKSPGEEVREDLTSQYSHGQQTDTSVEQGQKEADNAPVALTCQPLHDRVIILPDDAEQVTEGGIIIPDTAKQKPLRGRVMAFGKKCEELKGEEHVLYGRFAGTEIEIDKRNFLIMRESELLVIL